MSAATLPQDTLLPQPVGGNGPGAVLALLVHAGLITALAFGVDWRAQAPDVVSAELWAAVPQTAAPPPPPPPPPAPEPTPVPAPVPKPVPAPPPQAKADRPAPDITVERERQKAEAAKRKLEAERDKAEADRKKREQVEADRKEKAERAEKADKLAKAKAEQAAKLKSEQAAQAAEERLAQQREENLRRMLAQAGSAGAAPAGTATTTAAPSAAYAGLVRNAIRSQLSYTGDLSAIRRAAEIEVNAAPGGSIISRKLVKSSGTPDFDEAVLRAIDKAGSLPRNPGGAVPATLIISFRAND